MCAMRILKKDRCFLGVSRGMAQPWGRLLLGLGAWLGTGGGAPIPCPRRQQRVLPAAPRQGLRRPPGGAVAPPPRAAAASPPLRHGRCGGRGRAGRPPLAPGLLGL